MSGRGIMPTGQTPTLGVRVFKGATFSISSNLHWEPSINPPLKPSSRAVEMIMAEGSDGP